MTSAFEASSASTSSSRRGRSSPRDISRAAGVSSMVNACSTSAASAGMRAQRAASSARASAACAAPARTRRIAIPAIASSWIARSAGVRAATIELRRACARPRRGARSAAGAGPRGTAHGRHCVRSPCASRVADAAASALVRPARGRARRARFPPRRRRISREPRPLSDRRRAPLAAPALWRGRDRRAGPWRCRAARAPAHRRAAPRGSARRGDRPSRAPAPPP